ncbi:MAG: tripartite tricarboxylate transporter substrate binding protein [Burkholderiaceae bacterium]|nr:tripartite tricarboxylate transporter substrate binding protein [Burkholderiaceae bacterium]
MTTSGLLSRSLLAAGLLSIAASGAFAQWKPTRPITLIVPWAAGGSTDQVTRVAAAEVEKALGQKVVVMNQPGASGSVGTKNALEAAKDGYTWTAGAAKDLGTYKVLGMLDTSIQDWNLYLTVAHVSVVGVNADTPYKTMPELLAAMKAKPNSVSVATAGVNSSGHSAIEAIARATGTTYKHVTYDGGNPAVVSTLSGETQVTTQLAAEQTDMIRAKRIRPLAVVSDKPLTIEGYGTIPPLSQFMPGFKDPINYFGIFVPKGVPAEVKQTLDNLWNSQIAKGDALKKYAESRGAMFSGAYGDEAQKAVMPAIQSYAWVQQEAGKAKVSPDTIGIPKP